MKKILILSTALFFFGSISSFAVFNGTSSTPPNNNKKGILMTYTPFSGQGTEQYLEGSTRTFRARLISSDKGWCLGGKCITSWLQKDRGVFTWEQGGFGLCSVSCGGGEQYQKVWCQRNDGAQFSDSSCSPGTKPSTSQSCNTQACPGGEPPVEECPTFDERLGIWHPCE